MRNYTIQTHPGEKPPPLYHLGEQPEPDIVVNLRERTQYYLAHGKSLHEIIRSLGKSGLRDSFDKTKGVATTRYKLRWTPTVVPASDGYYLQSCKIEGEVVITLPRWSGQKRKVKWKCLRQGRYDLLVQWRRYLNNLRRHEHTHKRYVLEAVAAMKTGLEALAGGKTEAEVISGVNNVCRKAVSLCNRQHQLYDNETGHGRTVA